MSQPHDKEQRIPWHALSGEEALQRVDSNQRGLDDQEARRRLEEYGPNYLREKHPRPWWRRLLDQFTNVLIIILLIAWAITSMLGQWVDAGAIFAVVIINAAIGFFQEGKAEKALESIKGMLSPQATVFRNGRRTTIAAEELVPGDIVALSAGDRAPADLRLLKAKRLRIQEAALTGESEAVSKRPEPVGEKTDLADRSSLAFAGTMVADGSARGVVVETGRRTEIGRISEMLEEVEQVQTPLLRQIDRFAKVLAVVIVVIATAMALYGVLVHGYDLEEMFLASVGLAVAAIPQGLPALVTITFALGVQRMAQRNAIIRRLPAVETLGAVSTIFSDKTGTLTRNEMTLKAVVLADSEIEIDGVGFAPEGGFRHTGESGEPEQKGEPIDPEHNPLLSRLLHAGTLCNDSTLEQRSGEWIINGDPTEGAFIVAAAKASWDPDAVRRQSERIDSIPFDSERKYMATLDREPGGKAVIHVKGAPEVVLSRCEWLASPEGDSELDRNAWKAKIRTLSERGFRVLAVAEKPDEGRDSLEDKDAESGLVLLGLAGLLDPPRESAIEAVKKCRSAGIRVKMVTGDHALTARAIGGQLGLQHTGSALTGADIADLSDSELPQRVDEIDVFARAAPEHKLRLVEAIQSRGAVCAMTGDGVNDAPALKRADVGIAMGIQGTEAAKEAAEMVLADDNFATIANAVEEGRTIYDNVKKAITFLLPSNGGEAMSILGAVLFATALPITPVQILWVNMVTAVTLGLALAFEPAESDVMARAPRDPAAPILDRFLGWRVIFVSLLLVGAVFGLFLWETGQGESVEVARTLAVNMLVAGEIVYLFNVRRLTGSSLSRKGLLGSRAALVATALVIVFQLLWTYTGPMQFLFASAPLGPLHWGIILAVALAIFLFVELEKAIWRKMRKR
ncbi:cation-translocating P-type ATPase [Thiohalomonas denitrificans]|uniref:Potassium and/or sodium efflux P-type ATPase n=1 Tax=Thiohalomonas denitrificans TaxID=415747 RepID=A0A1G5Q3M8_9GAMM|nr:HAD-IC family P-type ATPase [Thiohalomonas denitrificans]SCZ56156.1 potassium and/or sodium efflux P-type ATPase [Thiohalomonas denitrificans]